MFFRRSREKAKGRGGPRPRHRPGPSIISDEVVIEGNVITAGELQIDGTINGSVRARAVIVDLNGIVHGDLSAEEVIVRGRVIGPIRGIHVHVFAGGHVEGDVINETLSIENGAYVDGKIRRSDDPLAEPADYGYVAGPAYAPYPQVYDAYEEREPEIVPVQPIRKPKAAE